MRFAANRADAGEERRLLASLVADAVACQLHNKLSRLEDLLERLAVEVPAGGLASQLSPLATETANSAASSAQFSSCLSSWPQALSSATSACQESPGLQRRRSSRRLQEQRLRTRERLPSKDLKPKDEQMHESKEGKEKEPQAALSCHARPASNGRCSFGIASEAHLVSDSSTQTECCSSQAKVRPRIFGAASGCGMADQLTVRSPDDAQSPAASIATLSRGRNYCKTKSSIPPRWEHIDLLTRQSLLSDRMRREWWFLRKYDEMEPERTSLLARIIHSSVFDRSSLLLIFVNIAISVRYANNTAAHLNSVHAQGFGFMAFEYLFVSFCFVEVCAKLWVHGLHFFTNVDCSWNWLDLLVLFLSVADITLRTFFPFAVDLLPMRILRVLRALKAIRALRAVRFLADFRLMLKCILASLVPLIWTCVLLLFVLLVFSLIFMQSMLEASVQGSREHAGIAQELFGSVQRTMVTLFQSVTGGLDWREIYDLLVEAGSVYGVIYLGFVVFFLISFVNISTSLFVEKALSLAQPDSEMRLLHRWQKDMELAGELRTLIEKLDLDHSGVLTRKEWMTIAQDPIMRMHFEVCGLHINDAHDFWEAVVNLTDVEEPAIETFVNGCMNMRGEASSAEVQVVITKLRSIREKLEAVLS